MVAVNMGVATLSVHGELHPDTEPGTILATQLADVRAAAAVHGTDPAVLSAVVVLPVWSVRRHLATLGLGPPVPGLKPAPPKNPTRSAMPGGGSRHLTRKKIRQALARAGGPLTVPQIATRTKLNVTTVANALRGDPAAFRPAGTVRTTRRPAATWGLAG